ncbi:hypothetical protein DRW48_02795 [Paracoccus suum]|uniref:Uncharacterized protein n=1 Tax=Paracoccus suum TaxID=2259340 RepID=A0A344PHA6_9RHOB|nr:hypothetical protein [Paracoccus suum]AXC48761.1 hypothetical protein DRW48_02795 [Paracoccus suum]
MSALSKVEGLRRAAAEDRAIAAGLLVSAAWVVLFLLVWLFGPAGDGAARSGAARLVTLVGVFVPLVLIWMAVGTARALAGLRDEAHDLRAQLLAMRRGAPADLPPELQAGMEDAEAQMLPLDTPAPRAVAQPRREATPRTAAAPRASAGRARTTAAAAPPQPSLDLGAPPAVEVDPHDLILALNFPDGPDDHDAVDALRRALADGETARLIRAAQDVITLLAARGLYMDDVPAPNAPAESWRRFVDGARGAALDGMDLPQPDPNAEAALAEALRSDEVFRDAAHHFLRHWDKLLGRAVPQLDDNGVRHLAATRSGRAFATLAQSTGIFG